MTHRDILTIIKNYYLDLAVEHQGSDKEEFYRRRAKHCQIILDALGEVADQAV